MNVLLKVSKLKEKRQLCFCAVFGKAICSLFINSQAINPSSWYCKIQTVQGTSQNIPYFSGPVTVLYKILALFELHLASVT